MPFVRGFLHHWRPTRPELPELPDRPVDPDYGIDWERPTLPPDFELPSIPPRDEWPPLPPFLQPGVGLPIPPTVEHPMVPVEPDPEVDPPSIWPPLPAPPTLPDFTGKTLCLAVFYISRHVKVVRWVIVDNEEAKTKFQQVMAWLKSKLPAGGIAGRPPARPTPG